MKPHSRRLRLRSAAEADIAETIQWYSSQGPSLASRFLETLSLILKGIEGQPELYPAVKGKTRRALFPTPFPYMVLYRIERDFITIYAVLHQARDPSRWQRR